jgi:hypothetical protein
VREYGDGRENGMLCKIFSLFLPLLIESLSGLIVVSVAVEVDVCAHLLLRRLLYHPGSWITTEEPRTYGKMLEDI